MMETQKIRVMLVDDHAIVRSGLSTFLMTCDDAELVGEAASGEQALALCDQVKPDVVLMDLMMPGMDGATATRLLRQKYPQIQVIILTSFQEQEMVQGALQAGAIGYLLKDITTQELSHAIRAAYTGRAVLAPQATQALVQAAHTSAEKVGEDLTPREKEVLALLVEGLNNNQISARLFLSISTTKFHVSSVLSKLGASSRTEAVSIALKHKLVG